MTPNIPVPTYTAWRRLADALLVPLMYLVSGTWHEVPQRTHFWNNRKLRREEMVRLDPNYLVHVPGVSDAARQRYLALLPKFHMPIIGGWREYVVFTAAPDIPSWHIGWVAPDVAGVSLVPITGQVRVLCGPADVWFFGVTPGGDQIQIAPVGYGRIGAGGPHVQTLLL